MYCFNIDLTALELGNSLKQQMMETNFVKLTTHKNDLHDLVNHL
jgi:hypothetical protein